MAAWTVTISCFKLGHQPNLILSDNKLSNQTLLRNLSPPKSIFSPQATDLDDSKSCHRPSPSNWKRRMIQLQILILLRQLTLSSTLGTCLTVQLSLRSSKISPTLRASRGSLQQRHMTKSWIRFCNNEQCRRLQYHYLTPRWNYKWELKGLKPWKKKCNVSVWIVVCILFRSILVGLWRWTMQTNQNLTKNLCIQKHSTSCLFEESHFRVISWCV